MLTIAAVINVPIFIVSLFLLQTKFRPEMQEDTYYSQYLERKYSTTLRPREPVDSEKQLARLAQDIVAKVTASLPKKQEEVVRLLKESETAQMADRFENSRALSELHLYPNKGGKLVDRWHEDSYFQEDIAALSTAGLIAIPNNVVRSARLTTLGKEVATRLEADNRLWNQRDERQGLEVAERKKGVNKRVQRTR